MVDCTRKPALLVVFFGVLSCSSPVEVPWDGEPLLQTEGFEFQVIHTSGRMEVTIPFSYTNHTGSKVLLSHCGGDVSPTLDMRRGDEWVTAWVPIRRACGSTPIQIKKGAEYRDTLRVYAHPFGSNTHPQFLFEDIEGTYRLRWNVAYSERNSEAQPLPLEFRISNEIFLKDS